MKDKNISLILGVVIVFIILKKVTSEPVLSLNMSKNIDKRKHIDDALMGY